MNTTAVFLATLTPQLAVLSGEVSLAYSAAESAQLVLTDGLRLCSYAGAPVTAPCLAKTLAG